MKQNDAEILFPARTVSVAGEQVTVNEITFSQGLRIADAVSRITSALADLLVERTENDQTSHVSAVINAFGKCTEDTRLFLASCTGKTTEWVDKLSDKDGTALLMAAWLVNKDFFIRRLRIEIGARLEMSLLPRVDLPASGKSLPH